MTKGRWEVIKRGAWYTLQRNKNIYAHTCISEYEARGYFTSIEEAQEQADILNGKKICANCRNYCPKEEEK
jgi:sulfur relay (sulfurtransferase) complex TusBCD TusD component (DsrE family)